MISKLIAKEISLPGECRGRRVTERLNGSRGKRQEGGGGLLSLPG